MFLGKLQNNILKRFKSAKIFILLKLFTVDESMPETCLKSNKRNLRVDPFFDCKYSLTFSSSRFAEPKNKYPCKGSINTRFPNFSKTDFILSDRSTLL